MRKNIFLNVRENCLICVASASVVWIGFPTTRYCRRQKIWSQNTFRAIVEFTPYTARTGPSCRVWCGGVNWVGPTARQVRSASECVGRRRHCRCNRRTHSDAERTCRAVGPTQFTWPDTTTHAMWHPMLVVLSCLAGGVNWALFIDTGRF